MRINPYRIVFGLVGIECSILGVFLSEEIIVETLALAVLVAGILFFESGMRGEGS